MAQRKFKGSVVLWVICLLGFPIALIVYLYLVKRRNPEKWIRKVLSEGGVRSREIDFWVAVSKNETDSFQSLLCTKYFNLFGMTVPEKRDSLRNGQVYMEGDDQDFSTYADFKKSVEDLLLWIAYTDFPNDYDDPDDFVDKLKSLGYFTISASSYLAGIKRFL